MWQIFTLIKNMTGRNPHPTLSRKRERGSLSGPEWSKAKERSLGAAKRNPGESRFPRVPLRCTQATIAILTLSLLLSTSCLANTRLIVESEEGLTPILKAIHHAHSTIDLAMYGFTDPRLIEALIESQNKGKTVRILLQHSPYKQERENLSAIKRLTAAHLPLHFAPPRFLYLHQKTLIIDHHQALVMTFNFTHSAFKNDRNFALVLTDPKEVSEIQQVFNADWQNQPTDPSNPDLLWSPVNSRARMLKLIDSAKTEIKVYAQGLSDYQFIGALARAAKRGLKVEILTSAPAQGGKWKYLQKSGVLIDRVKSRVIHAKVLIIDRKKALVGSINFTKPSLDNNRELSVLTHTQGIVNHLLNNFERDKESFHSITPYS